VQFLDRASVLELLDPAALIDALAVAMADLSAGRASMPPRIAATVPAGLLATMPAYCPSLNVLAAKLLTVHPGNVDHPVHQALITTFDPATGQPTALMDGDAITSLRTAAGSALSTRLLARPDAEVLAVIGTGPVSHAHARLVSTVRPFREIRLGGRRPAAVDALARDLAARGVDVRPCPIDAAVDGADVVCTATSTVSPIILAGALAGTVHVASVGYVPHGREVDPALYGEALVVVEHRATALQAFPVGSNDVIEAVESGVLDPDEIVEVGKLGELAGSAAHRRTLYKSVGVAIQDAAAAAVVLAAAERTGTGRTIDI
jgi:alanine dehydrogenase